MKIIFNKNTGDEITANGNGDINMKINRMGDLTMNGIYTIKEGKYNFAMGPLIKQEFVIDEGGIIGGGVHLSPTEVHELVESRGDDVVFFDGRNAYEARVGKFRNAIVPDVETTRDFVAEFESGKYDHLKSKPIVTYCTGGIRCEVLSAVMKSRGFEEVYQIQGGIVRYGEQFGDDGLWDGSLYIFDNRMSMDFSDHTKVLSTCDDCGVPTKDFYNRHESQGRKLALLCSKCATSSGATKPNTGDEEIAG